MVANIIHVIDSKQRKEKRDVTNLRSNSYVNITVT